MYKLEISLKEVLTEKEITQKELSSLTGIRQAAISELSNKKRNSLNIDHLEKIITQLGIDEIGRIIKIKRDD